MLMMVQRYFVDFRDPRKVGVPDEDVVEDSDVEPVQKEVPKPQIWRHWGLAVAPPPRDRGGISKWTL